MAKYNDRIKRLRYESGMTQSDFAKLINMSKSSVNMYERGEREPGINTLECIADAFNVDLDYLTGKSDVKRSHYIAGNLIHMPDMKSVPLIGTIACGTPILAQENLDGSVPMPETVCADFALRCKGDSMIDARIMDGDVIYIKQQPEVENGEIAAVLIDEEATLKRVYVTEEAITLMPCNPQYPPMVYTGEQLQEVRIIGKAVAFLSAVR